MNCLHCKGQVTESNGYETETGQWIHHGCSMQVPDMPRKKTGMSLKDMAALKRKIDASNAQTGW